MDSNLLTNVKDVKEIV